ncbi:MAG: phage tail tape measure protein [Alphaproteobacteria bacterium]|nr:MAG: phage tail tape measure protein [Alphaproteobacteria bacterium]
MMTALVRQGVQGRDILDGIGKSAAYLGVQLQLAPEQAAEFAAKMRTATSTTPQDMLDLMDVIQRTANLGVDSQDMLAGFSKLTPALDMVKIKGLEAGKAMAPLLATAIRTGMAGESAGNAYRKMFMAFFDARKLGAVNAVLGKQGINLDFTNGKGEFGGFDKMFAQLQKLKALTTAQRVPLLKKLFGDDAETLQVVQLMIDGGKEAYSAMQTQLTGQADLLMRVNAQLATLKNLTEAAMGNLTNMAAAIAETLAPEIKAFMTDMGDLANAVRVYIGQNPALVRTLTAAATAFVGLKLGALVLSGALTILGVGMRAFGGPWLLILQAVAMAAGVIIANWGPISAFFKGLWDDVSAATKSTWEGLVNWFSGIWDRISAFIRPIMDGVRMARAGIDVLSGRAPSLSDATAFLPRAQPSTSLISGRQNLNGEVTVRFDNAPQGLRVTKAETNQPGLTLNPDVGYSSTAWGAP